MNTIFWLAIVIACICYTRFVWSIAAYFIVKHQNRNLFRLAEARGLTWLAWRDLITAILATVVIVTM